MRALNRPRPRASLRGSLAGAVVALGLLAAACASGDSGGPGAGSAAEPGAAASEPDSGDESAGDSSGDSDDSASADATGTGTASGPPDRTGEVIRVGYVNNEGGAISIPELRIGGEVAIGAINAAGGIHGAVIEPIVCLSDGTPEGAVNCAVKLIEEDVVMAYMGLETSSEAAINLWLDAGIPYVGSHSWGPTERNSPGAFLLHAASGAFAVGSAITFAELGIDHVGVILQDSPAGFDYLDNVIAPVLERNGIRTERILVDSAAPDWTAAVAAAQKAGVGGLMGQLDEFGCIGMISAANTSGFDKPLFAGNCTAYLNLLGEAAVGVYSQGDQWIYSLLEFAPPQIQERLLEYADHMRAAGHEQLIDGFAVAPYATWFEIRPILEQIEGPITAAAVIDAFTNAGETPGWLGPNLRCGSAPWPAESSHCSAHTMVWQIQLDQDGVPRRVPVSDGFIDASEYSDS